MSLAASPPETEPAPARPMVASKAQLWTVLSGALLAMMLAALDQSIVNTALPRIVTELGGAAHLSWVVTAFMLTSTVTAPLYGTLSDIHGRRRMFILSILLFLAASLLCGSARSMLELIGFRAVQGMGAGGLLVLAQAAIGDVVSPAERPRYQGLFTGTFALTSVLGPVVGGIITQALSWRWIFYVNLPIGAIALAMIATGLRNPPPARARSIDYAGTLLLMGFTTTLLLLLASGGSQFPWISARSAALFGATAVLAGLFVGRERRAADPLIRLALFANPVFARIVTVSALVAFAMFGTIVFLPLYYQKVLGMTPAVAGTMVLPQVTGMVLSSVIGGRIVSRLGRSKPFLLGGAAAMTVAVLGLAGLAEIVAAPWLFLVAMTVFGLGTGVTMPNLVNGVQNAVARAELGAATGAMIFLRSLGGATGVAASGAILSGRMRAISSPLAGLANTEAIRSGLVGGFLLCGLATALAFLLLLGLREVRLRGAAGSP